MSATTYTSFRPDPGDSRRLNRAITWSVAVHLLLVAILLFLPSSWLTREPQKRNVMTINLGGTPGPRSTGTTSIGGRTGEQVAPPPKRPEPVRPTPKPEPAPAVAKAPPKPVPTPAVTKPAVVPRPEPPVSTRPPVTGPQVVAGNTAVETGARGQGAGLTFGGGGTGGETDLSNFCCPAYLEHLLTTIEGRWAKNQPERGTTTLKFTILKNGTIDNSKVTVEQSSGYGALDRAARAALYDARLMPLPAEYPNETLTVHLKFPYGTQ